MVDVTERQLRSWERQGLVPASEAYGFSGLLALKSLKRLRELKIKPQQIRLAMEALAKHLGDGSLEHPFSRFRITAEGRRITVHTAGGRMEPVSGQLLLDFDAKEIARLKAFPVQVPKEDTARLEAQQREAEEWFQKGLSLEETGAPPEDAAAAYRRAIALNPKAAGALVNLGTIAFRRRKMKEAAEYYARAVEADPEYPLARFNLGNLEEEQNNFEAARGHYLEAVRLNPRYADAYFNLALLCERTGDLLQAVGHWQNYLKLDSGSTWAATARRQLSQLKRSLRSK